MSSQRVNVTCEPPPQILTHQDKHNVRLYEEDGVRPRKTEPDERDPYTEDFETQRVTLEQLTAVRVALKAREAKPRWLHPVEMKCTPINDDHSGKKGQGPNITGFHLQYSAPAHFPPAEPIIDVFFCMRRSMPRFELSAAVKDAIRSRLMGLHLPNAKEKEKFSRWRDEVLDSVYSTSYFREQEDDDMLLS